MGQASHLKGREPGFVRLQEVGQEVDGARHPCEREHTARSELLHDGPRDVIRSPTIPTLITSNANLFVHYIPDNNNTINATQQRESKQTKQISFRLPLGFVDILFPIRTATCTIPAG